ncbi:HAD family hydrolase [Nocardioides sambongensis]|uniref:HAD family hydrolase n=1 Tax=Nocardioides sambongensis TaxID=2589074 RepID=UPI0011260A5D|nr:beta-phosphoglucomutase family hydrolase [Nocardioides sambongensis]
MDWNTYEAALFDLDGVVTPTAEVHMRAWAKMFTEFLADHPEARPYGDEDYFGAIDGKPRYDGVRSFLASRDITLPEGDPDDSPDAQTVCGLGNRKNEVFSQVLADEGVDPYPGSLALLRQLRAAGMPMSIVSSSRNAPAVLEAAGVSDFFTHVVHGGVAAEQGLAGKPAPDTFLYAARLLGAPADRAVVLEDAVSGVRAGASGAFGLVIGVDRGVGADALREAGADVVVADLDELLTDADRQEGDA